MTKSKFNVILNNQSISGYTVQETTHQNKKTLIVPVTMIVEGVLSGSRGPLLHLAEDFGKFPEAWNGIPVVINHPERSGKNISANSPDVIESGLVGRVYNTHVENNSLKAEVWLDSEKLASVSPDTLSAVGLQQPIEVSVGVFTEEEETTGTYNDRSYTAIAHNHRPDHLALLPGGVGACSLADGCGIRVNNNKKGEDNEMIIGTAEQVNQYRNLRYTIRGIVDNSSDGLKEKLEELRELVDSLDVQGDMNTGEGAVYHYLEEAYDTYLVYEQYSKGDEKYYKRGYQIDANGDAAFVGEPIEVEKKTEYINKVNTNQQFIRTKNPSKKESMEQNEVCTPCVKARVDALIANTASKFTEDDRAVLETLSESVLERMIPEAPVAPVVNEMSAEDKAALAFGKAQLKEKRDGLIANIVANTSVEVWPEATLNEMSDDMLERISKTITPKEASVDYSLNASGNSLQANKGGNDGKPAPLLPAGVEIK